MPTGKFLKQQAMTLPIIALVIAVFWIMELYWFFWTLVTMYPLAVLMTYFAIIRRTRQETKG